MFDSDATSLPSPDPVLRRVSRALEDSFDFPFQIWSARETESQLDDFGIRDQCPTDSDGPFTVCTFEEQHLLLIPLGRDSQPRCFAAGYIQTGQPENYLQMARYCLERGETRNR